MNDPHLEAARRASVAWGLDGAAVSELSRSENVVFRIDVEGDRPLVLRLHRPGYNSLTQLHSEVGWVRSLEQAGLPVPRAIAAQDGRHYVAVDVAGVEHQAGVVGWVDGTPLREHDPMPVECFRRLGELAAGIRLHAERWAPPAGFDRRRWDADGFVGDSPLWGRFWEADDLETDQHSVLSTARDALRDELGSLSTGPDRFGLIHADLHTANVMADRDQLTMIDFDDAGFGWWAHELAVALFDRHDEDDYDEARRLMLEGYRSVHPLDAEEEATIDTFLVVRHCMLVGWLDHRKDLEGYAEAFPRMAAGACTVAGEWLESRTT